MIYKEGTEKSSAHASTDKKKKKKKNGPGDDTTGLVARALHLDDAPRDFGPEIAYSLCTLFSR